MAMDDNGGARRDAITAAIAAELDRQARDGTEGVDVDALAAAVDGVLEPALPASEGRHPDELNATNDD